jgi:hypothetical protein
MAAVSFVRPHLLVMDEPTNNLDLESVQALAECVQKFDGGVLLVSKFECVRIFAVCTIHSTHLPFAIHSSTIRDPLIYHSLHSSTIGSTHLPFTPLIYHSLHSSTIGSTHLPFTPLIYHSRSTHLPFAIHKSNIHSTHLPLATLI